MKIYLDNCALQRPLDEKSQTRIRLEAESILSILEQCKAGTVELVSSETLEFEIEKNPLDTRREYGESTLEIAKFYVTINDDVERRASEFVNLGIKPMDALHLASAEEANADYFCTCDDRFLRRAKKLNDLKIVVMTPLELIEELNL